MLFATVDSALRITDNADLESVFVTCVPCVFPPFVLNESIMKIDLYQKLRSVCVDWGQPLLSRNWPLLWRGDSKSFDLFFDFVREAGRTGAVYDTMIER